MNATANLQFCPTCGEDEAFTGTCGTSDHDLRALCKRGQPVQPAFASNNDLALQEITTLIRHHTDPEAFEEICGELKAFCKRTQPVEAQPLHSMQDDYLLAARIAEGHRPVICPPLTMPLAGLLYATLAQPASQNAQPVQPQRVKFEARCRLSEECLPDAPYRTMLTALHDEMLDAISALPVALTDEKILAGVKEFADESYIAAHPGDITRCVRTLFEPTQPVQPALQTAAQAVLDRWNSPQWEWTKHGPTADLMNDLRKATLETK